jgi:hypothetical protein
VPAHIPSNRIEAERLRQTIKSKLTKLQAAVYQLLLKLAAGQGRADAETQESPTEEARNNEEYSN